MSVIASLVLGADGSSTFREDSEAITTPIDRQRFLARRRLSDAIVIGGNTARNERYQRTPVPVVVVSHSRPSLLDQNPQAHWWPLTPLDALSRAQIEFGSRISIEGGVAFVLVLLNAGAITQLELSITPHLGGENKVDYLHLLSYFEKVEMTRVDETLFYSCTVPLMLQR